MSIWCSNVIADDDDHTPGCPRLAPDPRYPDEPMSYVIDDTKDCTCNAGPIVYQGSHVLPADGDLRGGVLDLAEIPGYIRRGERTLCPPEGECGKPWTQCCDRVWPWLRLTAGDPVRAVTVLLDRAQVQAAADYLVGWLERSAPDTETGHSSDPGGTTSGEEVTRG